MSDIIYHFWRNYYLNITNRCPCACTFCVRQDTDALGTAECLWLEREPTVDEVMDAVRKEVPTDAEWIVFCGYGEPTERFSDMVEIAKRLKRTWKYRVRLDTNGLGNLINGRDIVPEMKGVFDAVSVSLNAPNEDRYLALTKSEFGKDSYQAVVDFIKECKKVVPSVAASIVGFSLEDNEIDECEAIARELGVAFRVR